MAAATAAEPSYLGLLNQISNGETGAGVFLTAWANATPDCELEEALRFVAARETSHGVLFCRRIGELGFELQPPAANGGTAQLAKFASPKVSDFDKISEVEGLFAGKDPFVEIEKQLADGAFDPLTAKLMTWYISEERDSLACLNEAYAAAKARCAAAMGMASPATNGNGSAPASDTIALMECMTAGFDRLEKALAGLAKAK
jgi:hypothetical protein